VTWNFKGWRITEYYDPQGHCDMIRYEGNDYGFSKESETLDVLRVNTPNGVLWKEDTPPTAWGGFRNWNSTEYIKNGVISENVVATLSPIVRQNGVNSEGVPQMIGKLVMVIRTASEHHQPFIVEPK
jgi:hypothetical protein